MALSSLEDEMITLIAANAKMKIITTMAVGYIIIRAIQMASRRLWI